MATPRVTVVIPAHDRPRALASCLQALADQTLDPERFEVVVVDDGSPAPLQPATAALAGRLRLTLERQENKGPAAARNRGAALARSPILAFTDDDCQPEPEWLATLVRAVEATPDALIGGRTVNRLVSNPYATASQLLIDYLYEDHLRGTDPTPFFTSNNLALSREVFDALDGFDESFPRAAAEERDFCDRARHRGFGLRYEPEARVRHAHRMDFRGFWRQHYGYGRGARRFHQRRAERGFGMPRPRPSFYLGILTAPWRLDHSGSATPKPLLAFLLTVSQVANTLGFARQALS